MASTAATSAVSRPKTDRHLRRGLPGTPVRYVDRARLWASVSLLVMAALLVAGVQGSWWQVGFSAFSPESNQQVQFVTVEFHLGGSATCASSPWQANITPPCANVSGRVDGTVGAYDTALDVALPVLAGLSGIAWGLATLANVGVRGSRRQLDLEIALALAVTFAIAATLIGSIALGPGPQAAGYCSALSGQSTSCPSFFGGTTAGVFPGACDTCDNSLGWGAGLSFYEALGALALGAITGGWLLAGRKGPYTAEEVAVWAERFRDIPRAPEPVVAAPASLGAPWASALRRPPASAIDLRFKVAESDWDCPSCGNHNSRWAVQCSRCHGDRPLG
jgi:Zn-finger in Ran binding protein and others